MSEAVAVSNGRTAGGKIIAILKLLFVPNQFITWRTKAYLIVAWVFAACAFWWNSPTVFVPSLPTVYAAFHYLWFDRGLSRELLTSFLLILEAVFWMTVITAVICYLYKLNFFCAPAQFIGALRFLSTAGLGLLVNLYIQDPHTKKLAIMVFFMVAVFVPSFIVEIDNVASQKYNLARTLRMNNWTIVNEIVVRGQLHKFISCALLSSCMGFMLLTLVERWFREEGGVGAMLNDSEKHFSIDQIWAIQITVMIMGYGLLDFIGNLVNRKLCRHAYLKVERR